MADVVAGENAGLGVKGLLGMVVSGLVLYLGGVGVEKPEQYYSAMDPLAPLQLLHAVQKHVHRLPHHKRRRLADGQREGAQERI